VPPETIRRRYRAGLKNFFDLYEPLVSSWAFYDNSAYEPQLLAERLEFEPARVYDRITWAFVTQRGQR
jgi:predicted ABC-type ATPase